MMKGFMTMTDCSNNTIIDNPCEVSIGLPVGTDSGIAGSCNFKLLDNVVNGNEDFYYNRVGKKVTSLNSFISKSVLNLYLTPYDFGAKGDGVTDDTGAMEQYFSQGGALYGAPGVFRITRPIVVKGLTSLFWPTASNGTGGFPDIGEANTDYLDTLLDEASEGAGIIYVDLNGWTNPNNETHAITFREPRARNLASVSINNFKISSHIDNPAPVGLIKINGAYDNNSMFNVNAVFGGDDHPVIEVTKGIAEGTLGQSVNWTGVNAIGATGGNRTAPTIKINWLQEGTFNSCKAFGSPYRVDGEGDPLYSANPCWEIDNSRGLVWIGSSAALTLGSGFLFKATERSCQYHTMVGCTYELIGRVESTLFLSNVSIYTEGGGLLETPQASAFNVGQLVKFGQAATQEYKILAIGDNELFVQPAMPITTFVDDVYEVSPASSAIEIHKESSSGLASINVISPRIEAPVGHFLWAHADDGLAPIANIKAETIFGRVTLDNVTRADIDTYSDFSVQALNSNGISLKTSANANDKNDTVNSFNIKSSNSPGINFNVNPNNLSDDYRIIWSADAIEDFGFLFQNERSGKHMLHNVDGSFTVNDGVDFQSTVNYVKIDPTNGVDVVKSVSPSYRFTAGNNSELTSRITYSASTELGELSLDFRMFSGASMQLSDVGDLFLNRDSGGTGNTGLHVKTASNADKRITVNDSNNLEINGSEVLGGQVNVGENLGSGSGVYAGKSGVSLRFKSISGAGSVNVSATSNDITISATDTVYGTVNVGSAGEGIAYGVSSGNYQFRRINEGVGINVVGNGDQITISSSLGTVNVGTGEGVAFGTDGSNFKFRRIKGAAGEIAVTSAGDDIEIKGDGATGSFTSSDGKTISVSNGIITSIV